MTPARPGVRVRAFDSSLRLIAVSHPQKKNTPSTRPAESAPRPPIEKGLSQDQWKALDPAGWLATTLAIPQSERTTTATYSTPSRTHWRLLVQRMPATQIRVTTTSHPAPTRAASPTDWATDEETHPQEANSWSV